jgi:7-carboxy-7-deazaguanine synthase
VNIEKESKGFIMLKVNEIFNSFQGEGPFAGRPATFLRLAGCNLKCDFCDTNHKKYDILDVNSVKEKVKECMSILNTNFLVITGGEPLLQDDINELALELIKEGYIVQFETNGSIKHYPMKAHYVVSPKQNIKEVYDNWKFYSNVYFKFVVQNREDLELLNEIIDIDKVVYLQPEYSNANEITKLILNTPLNFNYRISGQLHRYLGVD